MLFSASYAYAYYNDGSSYAYISRQGMFAVLGVAAMLFISTFDYHHYHKFAWPVMGVAVLFLSLVMLFKALGLKSLAPNEGGRLPVAPAGPPSTSSPPRWPNSPPSCCSPTSSSQNLDKMGTFYYGGAALRGDLRRGGRPHLSGEPPVRHPHRPHAGGHPHVRGGAPSSGGFLLGGGALGSAPHHHALLRRQLPGLPAWTSGWTPSPPTWTPTSPGRPASPCTPSAAAAFLGVGLGQSRDRSTCGSPSPQNDFIFAVVCEELGLLGGPGHHGALRAPHLAWGVRVPPRPG